MTDADIGQLQSTQDWINEGRRETMNDTQPCCPVCGHPHCPNPQRPLVMMVPRSAHQLLPGDTAHWYEQRTNDPGPGRIDAVVTSDDWRQDVNAYNREAYNELPDDEEGES